jgi:Tol biopolymer transport system component
MSTPPTEIREETTAPVMSTPPTEIREETTAPVMPTRPTERIKRIELDGIRNGKIAFDHHVVTTAAGSVPEEDIWTVNPDGSNRAQLTANSRYWDETPAWSPDGRQIAFVKADSLDQPDFAEKLYVMNADGSNKIELPLPKGVSAYEPTWSPDGDRIAFWDPTYGGLYMTHTDGSGTLRKLSTPGLPGGDARPVWSPDGSKIAFINGSFDRPWADIYIMNVSPEGDTSELRQLTNHPMEEAEPSWSPDGTEIAFSSNRVRGGEIYKIDVNSLRETRLTHSSLYDHEPTWSPDGKQIAYVRETLGSGDLRTVLYKMDSDGTNPTPVFAAEGEQAHHPDWGPRLPAAQGKSPDETGS